MYASYEAKTSHGECSVLMVSLGTGVRKADFRYETLVHRGSLRWLGPILELLMSANSEATHNQLSYLLNGRWHDPANSNELTSVAVDDGGFDVNSGDLVDRHWFSRYLRYQVPLRAADSRMENATRENLRHLELDTETYLQTRSEGTTEQTIGDDVDDLAHILRDLSIVRAPFPNAYRRPPTRGWATELDFMQEYARALEALDAEVPR